MKLSALIPIVVSTLTLPLVSLAGLPEAIATLKAVGAEGEGNEDATKAWTDVSKASPEELTDILASMDGANPIAENWLRAAAGVVADNAIADEALPLGPLKAFLLDTSHDSAPRTLAFDLIQRADADLAAAVTPELLDDPSAALRRHPVGRLIEEGAKALEGGDKAAAVAAWRKGLDGARDQDQIDELAKNLRDQGEAVDLPAHFGFLLDWHLIAPFSNEDRNGFDVAYPPEETIDFEAEYEGFGQAAKWVEFSSEDEYGMVDFNKPFDMLKSVVGYAYTEFESTEARAAEIRLGCKNGWKVWLNGELLFERDEYHRGMKLDQYKLPCELAPGKNTLLVKCCQNEQTEQWTVEWQFQLRICDATGTAILAAK
jgi:hypothetical protein